MVRHQAESQQPGGQTLVGRGEQFNELDIIVFIVKDACATGAAVEDVIADAADGSPGSPW